MKNFVFTLLVLLNFTPLFGQIDDVSTSGDNSPAVIAANLSVTYGVRADAIEAILWIYEEEGYDVGRRKRATEQILHEYGQSPEKQQASDELTEATRNKMGITDAPEITNALEWDLFAGTHYLSTTGYNSPAFVARGDVNIWYGISSKALRALAVQLEKNKTDLTQFETQLGEQAKKYEELKTELATYGSQEEIYRQAEALLEEGKLEEAEQLIEADYHASKKKQAYKGYIYGKTKELLLKYEEAAKGYLNAVQNDEGNSTYRLYYADNEKTLANHDEAIKHYEIALGIDTLKSSNEERIATLFNNLGLVWHSKGGYDKAMEYHEKALQIDLQAFSENHPNVVRDYNNLGLVSCSKGSYDQAIAYYEKSLQIYLQVFGENHPKNGTIYNNLGSAWHEKGSYDQAIAYYEKALQIDLLVFDENHPNVAIRYNNLGTIWSSKGEYDKAIGYHEKALEIRLVTFGERHPDVAISYNNLGLVSDSKGEYDKAIGYHEKALEIRLATFGERHPYVAISYNNLGAAWQSKGEYNKAIGYHEKALEICLAIFGERHPDVAMSYNNLGTIWSSKREYDKALEYFEKALEVRLVIFGEQHPDVAMSYNNLGTVWNSKREYDKSIEYYEKALEVRLVIFGEQHPDVAMSYNNLGGAWYSKGEYEKAIGYYEKALEIRVDIFGERHPDVALFYNNLGWAWLLKAEYDKALEYFEKALKIRVDIFGERHPDIAISYSSLGTVWNSKGEYDKAIEYFEKCQVIWDFFLESTHPSQKGTAVSLSLATNSRGMELYNEKRYSEALGYFQKALKNAQRAKDDAFSLFCLTGIGASQKYLENYEEGLESLDAGLHQAFQLNQELDQYIKEHLTLEMLDDPEMQNKIAEWRNLPLIRRMQYHKIGCLKGLKRNEEADALAKQLWLEGTEANDTRLLEDLRKEGYDFGE